MTALVYAVHHDGAVLERADVDRFRRLMPDERTARGCDAVERHLDGRSATIFRDAEKAVALATDLKRAWPDELVSIVLWPDDGDDPERPAASA